VLETSASQILSSVSSTDVIDVIHFQKELSPQHPSNDEGDSTKKDTLKTTVIDLASLSPLDYDLKRKEVAKELGVQVKTLDAEVKTARNDIFTPSSMMFPDVAPFSEPVNPADLFNEVAKTIQSFVVLNDDQALAMSLWIAMTWLIDVLKVAPLAIINAPEKACGKSQLLDITGFLSNKALPSSNITTAGLFRITEMYGPTLLIDEVDTFMRDNNDLKGLINAGHTRNSAFVIRIVGENNEPKRFNVYGAKALAGISLEKHLPDSTMSRAIVFNMRRKLPSESVQRLRHAKDDLFETLKAKLARFAVDYAGAVKASRPELPAELGDRAQDNWEPLLAIAGCAGAEYLLRATEAALKLSVTSDSTVSIGTELLQSIQFIFENEAVDKIGTASLIHELGQLEDQPWDTYNKGWPVTPRQIAQLLKQYGIKPKTVRLTADQTPKGYSLDQFEDAFARYLSMEVIKPPQCNDASQAAQVVDSSVAEQTQHERQRGGDENVATEVSRNTTLAATPQASPNITCGGVADVAANSEPQEEAF
jgi:putative DNA primase/helicase